MLDIQGKNNTARVFTNKVDETASSQIKELCNQEFTRGQRIRVMSDVHAGKDCVIGLTVALGNNLKVVPNIVSFDIGCGMLTVKLGVIDIDLCLLDNIIRDYIPSGRYINKDIQKAYNELTNLKCYSHLKGIEKLRLALGSLGGGNHFIEVDEDEVGCKYLIIHSGSRNLGQQVGKYYQDLAIDRCCGKGLFGIESQKLIDRFKAEGRASEISNELAKLRCNLKTAVPKHLAYLEGEYVLMYLHDMGICQRYASLNREIIASNILQRLLNKGLDDFTHFETIHNYIDLDNNIIRKGAVSAQKGEKLLIPINMLDGSLLCEGKGNEDWNYSAPHGAGRVMSRRVAKEKLNLSEFKDMMSGVYTTSVNEGTLDECPLAYKGIEDILEHITPTVKVLHRLRVIYNFKASL